MRVYRLDIYTVQRNMLSRGLTAVSDFREAAQWSLSGARGFSGWSLVTYEGLLLI